MENNTQTEEITKNEEEVVEVKTDVKAGKLNDACSGLAPCACDDFI